jgi:hypothetical protein
MKKTQILSQTLMPEVSVDVNSALAIDRLQFAFTITFHYLFPQLTMGLALLIVIFKALALFRKDELYNKSARFWARIFAINFAIGVVTGIPMEFQFGTNWAAFSKTAGGVIGQTLAMEGVFSFFLESSFLGPLSVWRKAPRPKAAPRVRVPRFLGVVVVGILYHCHGCVDAAPCRLRDRT